MRELLVNNVKWDLSFTRYEKHVNEDVKNQRSRLLMHVVIFQPPTHPSIDTTSKILSAPGRTFRCLGWRPCCCFNPPNFTYLTLAIIEFEGVQDPLLVKGPRGLWGYEDFCQGIASKTYKLDCWKL